MDYVSLPLKYRPQKLDDVVGQKHIVKTLRNAIKLGRIGHAYLFIGPAGTGKTSIARIWSKEMNCESDTPPCCKCRICKEIADGKSLDVIELNAADKRRIEDIRESLERLKFKPMAKYKILILDECHMLTAEAWNALLKDLEEPAEQVIFILCTTNPEKIPKTIISRCQTFQFNSVEISDVVERLVYICDEENYIYDEDAVKLIAEFSNGGMRDAVSALEQIACFSEDNITVETVVSTLGLIESSVIDEIVDAVFSKDAGQCIEILYKIVESDKNLGMLFTMLSDRFRSIIRQSIINKDNLSTVECFKISKILLDYEKDLRYSCDKFYVLVCMFDALTHLENFDLNTRLAKLEQMVQNGDISASKPDALRLDSIKRKLDNNENNSNNELIQSVLNMSKGRLL